MKNKILPLILISFFIFVFIIFYKGLSNSNLYTPSVDYKSKVPEFSAVSFDKKEVFKSDDIFKTEKFYLLNIWASWCVPCKEEHPFLMSLRKNKKIEIIGLNYKDNLNSAKKFLNDLGNPYSLILLDYDGINAIEWGAYGVPETFLIHNNQIIKKIIGPLNLKLVEEIEEIAK